LWITHTKGEGIEGETSHRDRAKRVKRARGDGLMTKGAESSRRK
jgi:hypothetical protein